MKLVTLPPILGHPGHEASASANDNQVCAPALIPMNPPIPPSSAPLAPLSHGAVAALGLGAAVDGALTLVPRCQALRAVLQRPSAFAP